VNLVVAVFVQDLEFDWRECVAVEHFVDDLDRGHVFAVESILDLQHVEVVLEVVEDAFELVGSADCAPAADEVLQFLEALARTAFGSLPFDLLFCGLFEFDAGREVQFYLELIFQVLEVACDFLLAFVDGSLNLVDGCKGIGLVFEDVSAQLPEST